MGITAVMWYTYVGVSVMDVKESPHSVSQVSVPKSKYKSVICLLDILKVRSLKAKRGCSIRQKLGPSPSGEWLRKDIWDLGWKEGREDCGTYVA